MCIRDRNIMYTVTSNAVQLWSATNGMLFTNSIVIIFIEGFQIFTKNIYKQEGMSYVAFPRKHNHVFARTEGISPECISTLSVIVYWQCLVDICRKLCTHLVH